MKLQYIRMVSAVAFLAGFDMGCVGHPLRYENFSVDMPENRATVDRDRVVIITTKLISLLDGVFEKIDDRPNIYSGIIHCKNGIPNVSIVFIKDVQFSVTIRAIAASSDRDVRFIEKQIETVFSNAGIRHINFNSQTWSFNGRV